MIILPTFTLRHDFVSDAQVQTLHDHGFVRYAFPYISADERGELGKRRADLH
jgi:hypothetical protein